MFNASKIEQQYRLSSMSLVFLDSSKPCFGIRLLFFFLVFRMSFFLFKILMENALFIGRIKSSDRVRYPIKDDKSQYVVNKRLAVSNYEKRRDVCCVFKQSLENLQQFEQKWRRSVKE